MEPTFINTFAKTNSKKMAFIKLPGHRQYDYKPMFYNEQADKRQERQKKIEREYRCSQGEQIDEAPNFIHFARKERQKSNKRIFIIFIILVAVYYFLQQRFLS